MKLFISWSGPRSKAVAEILRDWFQDVIQALQPWLSASDIDKGARWRSEISAQLEEAKVGIICLTRENLEAPWLLFEAGALSKLQDKSYVCTFLLDLEPTDVREPLAQFQSTKAEKGDVLKLMRTINAQLLENALSAQQLERAFDRAWPELDEKLSSIPKPDFDEEPVRDPNEILDEILGLVRNIAREQISPRGPLLRSLLGHEEGHSGLAILTVEEAQLLAEYLREHAGYIVTGRPKPGIFEFRTQSGQ